MSYVLKELSRTTYLTLEDIERPIETMAAYMRRHFAEYRGKHWREKDFADLFSNLIESYSAFLSQAMTARMATGNGETQEELKQAAAAQVAAVLALTEKLADVPTKRELHEN